LRSCDREYHYFAENRICKPIEFPIFADIPDKTDDGFTYINKYDDSFLKGILKPILYDHNGGWVLMPPDNDFDETIVFVNPKDILPLDAKFVVHHQTRTLGLQPQSLKKWNSTMVNETKNMQRPYLSEVISLKSDFPKVEQTVEENCVTVVDDRYAENYTTPWECKKEEMINDSDFSKKKGGFVLDNEFKIVYVPPKGKIPTHSSFVYQVTTNTIAPPINMIVENFNEVNFEVLYNAQFLDKKVKKLNREKKRESIAKDKNVNSDAENIFNFGKDADVKLVWVFNKDRVMKDPKSLKEEKLLAHDEDAKIFAYKNQDNRDIKLKRMNPKVFRKSAKRFCNALKKLSNSKKDAKKWHLSIPGTIVDTYEHHISSMEKVSIWL